MTLFLFDGETGQAVRLSPSAARRLAAGLQNSREPLGFFDDQALALLNRHQGLSTATAGLDALEPAAESEPVGSAMMLTVEEAAERLGVSPQTVRRLPAEELPWFRPSPGTIRYRTEDVEAYLEETRNR